MRNNYSCFWGSSYDRGLEHLLTIWPTVKAAVPEAELHIYYGWNLYDAIHRDNPERVAWKEKIDKMMDQPGITHHGRVGQAQLTQEMPNYGIWAYPTDFDEISCINAIKSQAFGLIPVTMNRAALAETVQYGTKLNGDITDPKVRELYAQELILWLKDHTRQEETRKFMMPWAREHFAWSQVAETWTKEFKEPPENPEFKKFVEENVIPALEEENATKV